MTAPAFSPLAWELARRAVVGTGTFAPYDVRAELTMSDGDVMVGDGATATEAMRALAVAIDAWCERTRVDDVKREELT